MIDVSDIPPCDIEFITDLRHRMQQLNPVATSAHCTDRFYIHPSLKSSSHIFLKVDRVQPPLRQPYTGPHKVLCRTDKTITVDINGRKTTVSLDRVKPAHLLPETALSPPPVIKNLKSTNVNTSKNDEPPTYVTRSGRRGHETVSAAIAWALYLIGLHSDVQTKLHEEMDKVFGEDTEQPASERNLSDLQYLDCVLKETNRLYPTAPVFGREIQEDTNISGHIIPKGTTCAVVTYFLHRDEEVFPDAEIFDPERFSLENCIKIPEYAYIPFSAGPRNCIGQRFAMMEIKVIISSILRNFSIESLDTRDEVKPFIFITLHPSPPIRIRIRPRGVVCNLWKQFQDTGSIERKPEQGRSRATTATKDCYLSIIARRNKGATASQVSRDLYAATGTRLSRVTVSKRLHETGLFARRPAVLRPAHFYQQESPFSMVQRA
ncbi:Cytochrome P450 4c3 [Araneus ventricosus]|uniref:Cytochrome P450 4c3 n=1 Tax=Araneus ventricosus TaxID=182803 RepID=A0A4Y2EGU8_ARAVE|nr:Cytochrome P450 4c3 [Araneus ventricosus]